MTTYKLNAAGKLWLRSELSHALKADLSDILPETFDDWVEACEAVVCDRIPGEHEPGYEVRGIYAPNQKPYIVGFADAHFDALFSEEK